MQPLTAAKETLTFGFFSCSLTGGQIGGQDMAALGVLASEVSQTEKTTYDFYQHASAVCSD